MGKVLKKCPSCNSTKIQGGVELRDGCYYQVIKCPKCGYSNNRLISNAEQK